MLLVDLPLNGNENVEVGSGFAGEPPNIEDVPNLDERDPEVKEEFVSLLKENVAATLPTSTALFVFSISFTASSTADLNSSANSLVLNLTAKSSGAGSFSEKSVAAHERVLSLFFLKTISFVR